MCLLLLAVNTVPGRPWLLLGNRDEFHQRATAPAQPWDDAPGVIGGRDLQAGGSWLAIHRSGRFAAVTNVRRPGLAPAARSRGGLVSQYVSATTPPASYAREVAAAAIHYGPFNLIVGDREDAYFVSSLDAAPRRLGSGVHAFSNGSLDDEWPKMRRLREGFAAVVAHERWAENASDAGAAQRAQALDTALIDLLRDDARPADADLPHTGIDLALERQLASMFVPPITVHGDAYGTRASTLAYARADGGLVLRERSFDAQAHVSTERLLDC